MAGRDQFEILFREFLTGTLSRREAMLRAAGIGVGAEFVGPTLASAATGGRGRATLGRNQDASPTPKTGGTLKMGMQADPTALDPQKQTLTAIWKVTEHLYNGLTQVAPDLSIIPELAESWTVSDDGLTVTFKLRQGVTFHNGRPLVADDVVYSYQRLVDPATASTGASTLDSMASIAASDDSTVVLTLKQPDSSIFANLAGSVCYILPKEVIEENGDLSQVAVGTGPFKFVEYIPNTSVKMERNADFFVEGQPYLDGLELLIAPDDTSRTTALVSGTVDFIEYVPSKDVELLQGDSSIALAGNAIMQIRMLGFNTRKEPFNNVKVRQAIDAVLDREAIVQAALFGLGTPTVTLFPEGYWAALEKPVPAPDVAKAKQLMIDAGYPDGFSAKITGWTQYDYLKNSAIIVQEQLKQIGIEVELNLVENATMIQQVYTDHDYDMVFTGNSGFVDPNTLVLDAFKSTSSGNFTGYNNPEVDTLIDQGIAEPDQEKRAEIYRQIQEILLVDLPWASCYIGQQYEAMKSYVKGYTHVANGANWTVRVSWLDQ
jgi:peptide/nickel transport system substrate-binding protein